MTEPNRLSMSSSPHTCGREERTLCLTRIAMPCVTALKCPHSTADDFPGGTMVCAITFIREAAHAIPTKRQNFPCRADSCRLAPSRASALARTRRQATKVLIEE